MGDEEGAGAPYTWTSLEPLQEGQEEAPTGKFVKSAGRCVARDVLRVCFPPRCVSVPSPPPPRPPLPRSAKVAYPNGDSFEGAFNEAKQKHGKGAYVWGTGPGANAFVPEGDGYPGA
jgi:hypothetical protein